MRRGFDGRGKGKFSSKSKLRSSVTLIFLLITHASLCSPEIGYAASHCNERARPRAGVPSLYFCCTPSGLELAPCPSLVPGAVVVLLPLSRLTLPSFDPTGRSRPAPSLQASFPSSPDDSDWLSALSAGARRIGGIGHCRGGDRASAVVGDGLPRIVSVGFCWGLGDSL